MCGTPSCRGYLEVFEDEEHMREMTGLRSGLWVSSNEAKQLATTATATSSSSRSSSDVNKDSKDRIATNGDGGSSHSDSCGQTNDHPNSHSSGNGGGGDSDSEKKEWIRVQAAKWLVQKRIKVWWEGNDAFFEADVVSYDPVSGLHKVHYLVDDDMSEEMLWPKEDTVSDMESGSGGGSSNRGDENDRKDKDEGFNLLRPRGVRDGSSGDGRSGGATAALWQMLDETRQEKSIGLKKRVSSDALDPAESGSSIGGDCGDGNSVCPSITVPPLSKPMYSYQQPSPAAKHPRHSTSPLVNKKIMLVDKTVTLEYTLCAFVVNQYKLNHPTFSVVQSGDVAQNKKIHLFSQFAEIVRLNYSANCRLLTTQGTSPGGTLNTDDATSFCAVVFGEAKAVDKVTQFVDAAKDRLW